jgi:hypothetical protein
MHGIANLVRTERTSRTSTAGKSPKVHDFGQGLAVFDYLAVRFRTPHLRENVGSITIIGLAYDHVPEFAYVTSPDLDNFLVRQTAGQHLFVTDLFGHIHRELWFGARKAKLVRIFAPSGCGAVWADGDMRLRSRSSSSMSSASWWA